MTALIRIASPRSVVLRSSYVVLRSQSYYGVRASSMLARSWLASASPYYNNKNNCKNNCYGLSRRRFAAAAAASASDLFGDPYSGLPSLHSPNPPPPLKYAIPRRIRQKVVSPHDAVALVRNGDTVSVSGFVAQGAPEALLKALGERYQTSQEPKNLTLLFGGGPGDWATKGLNHLAEPGMLKRTIGSHYGQIPRVAELALTNQVEAWTLPLGSISRMLRAQSTHSPGHITSIGLGTYLDPAGPDGSACNDAARASTFRPVARIDVEGQPNLIYRALPVNVALIRGTTADPLGNITVEHESLLCDQLTIAAAARNSGGIVIAQVKRLAANGSLKSKDIAIPSPLVDCVVVVDEPDHAELHPMSYVERHNALLTGEIKAPEAESTHMPLDIRKLIARRAFFGLKPNTVVNLGIGLPEGVANIAAEESLLDYITLTTEPGSIGGLPCSGHSFGPARNATALVEMNQMFDFYDGGLLDICFLGAAQISANGDVNVSRMSEDRLTGPGGFVNITQSTENVYFMSPFTAKGLELKLPGDGTLSIATEGKVRKFVPDVFEKTFSGTEAVRRGQKVFYVTERAVFRRTAAHPVLELIEIAPGIDLQKDVLDQMNFQPVISPDLKLMDGRIFRDAKMNVTAELFGSFQDRATYHPDTHMVYLDLFGIILTSEDDINWFFSSLRRILDPFLERGDGRKFDITINYDGFDCRKGLEDLYAKNALRIEEKYFKSVKRYAGAAFHRARLAQLIAIGEWDPDELFDTFDHDKDGKVSIDMLRKGMLDNFQMRLTPSQIAKFRKFPEDHCVEKETFLEAIEDLLKSTA